MTFNMSCRGSTSIARESNTGESCCSYPRNISGLPRRQISFPRNFMKPPFFVFAAQRTGIGVGCKLTPGPDQGLSTQPPRGPRSRKPLKKLGSALQTAYLLSCEGFEGNPRNRCSHRETVTYRGCVERQLINLSASNENYGPAIWNADMLHSTLVPLKSMLEY